VRDQHEEENGQAQSEDTRSPHIPAACSHYRASEKARRIFRQLERVVSLRNLEGSLSGRCRVCSGLRLTHVSKLNDHYSGFDVSIFEQSTLKQ
jgi:hypothetical protein